MREWNRLIECSLLRTGIVQMVGDKYEFSYTTLCGLDRRLQDALDRAFAAGVAQERERVADLAKGMCVCRHMPTALYEIIGQCFACDIVAKIREGNDAK